MVSTSSSAISTISTLRKNRNCRIIQKTRRISPSSGLQKSADGSVDVFFDPKVPAGKESNWVPTNASGKFEVLFRIYGPEKPFFDKTWVRPDIER